ncbi:MAG: prepilin-type N-terminal cleavage/methylation domain-containing protein [Kiritimatiellia bacterium]
MLTTQAGRFGSKSGFTLPEVMIAGALGTLVSAAVMAAFLWTGKQSNLCNKISLTQTEVLRTSGRMERFIRNAASIAAIDESKGNWVEVAFPDGTTGRFTYYDSSDSEREGRLYLERNDTERLIVQGITKIPSATGYSLPLFSKINDRAIRVAFRVATLTPTGRLSCDDGSYASSARFAVCLRNAKE